MGGVRALPRVFRDQRAWTVAVPREQARPGDLVFFGHPVTHVGLLTGDDRMVDASQSRGGVVERAVWRSGVVRYGRVPRPGMPAVRPWTPPPLPAPGASGVVADTSSAPARAGRTPAAAPRPPGRPRQRRPEQQPQAAPRPGQDQGPAVVRRREAGGRPFARAGRTHDLDRARPRPRHLAARRGRRPARHA